MNDFKSRQEARIAAWGLPRTLAYIALGVVPDKLGVQLLSAFEYRGAGESLPTRPGAQFAILNSMDQWTSRDMDRLRGEHGEAMLPLFASYFDRGDACATVRLEGTELACMHWIQFRNDYPLTPKQRCAVLHNSVTWPEHRGQGLYPWALASSCRYLLISRQDAAQIFVDCSVVNYASLRGIDKAGFTPAGNIVCAFGRSWGWRRRPNSNRVTAPAAVDYFEVEEVRTLDDVRAFAPQWREFLAGDVRGESLFNDPAFVLATLELDPQHKPWIVIVRCGGRICCVAPFCWHEGKLKVEFSVLPLTSLRVHMLRSFGGEFVLAAEADVDRCFQLTFDCLWSRRTEYGLICLENTPVGKPLWQYCQAMAMRDGRFRFFLASSQVDTVHQIHFPATHAEYLSSLSYETRRKLRRYTRHLRGAANVRLERVDEPEQIPAFLDQLDDVYRNTWQAQAKGYSPRNSSLQVCFYMELSRVGYLRSYLLTDDLGPLAFAVGCQHNGVYYFLETGYRQARSDDSPGMVLMHLFIEDLFRHDQPTVLDFLLGDQAYKRSFSNVRLGSAYAYLAPPNGWRRVLQIQRCLHFLSRHAVRMLGALRMDRAARKLLGRRA